MRTRSGSLRCVALSVAVAFTLGVHIWERRTERTQHERTYTARQILARSDALCRTLVPGAGDLSLSVNRDNAYRRDGALQPFWAVQCTDGRGNSIAVIWWDAYTGNLLFVSGPEFLPTRGEPTVRNAREAAAVAQGWMRALRVAGREETWRLRGTPERCEGSTWIVRWRAEGWTASLQLGPAGNLLIAKFWPAQWGKHEDG